VCTREMRLSFNKPDSTIACFRCIKTLRITFCTSSHLSLTANHNIIYVIFSTCILMYQKQVSRFCETTIALFHIYTHSYIHYFYYYYYYTLYCGKQTNRWRDEETWNIAIKSLTHCGIRW